MEPLIKVYGLKKYFNMSEGIFRKRTVEIRAVDGIDLTINRGEVFGMVGESGCGKTTFGKTLIRLLDPTSGHVLFEAPMDLIERLEGMDDGGKWELVKEYDVARFKGKQLKALRRKMQIVYQDPRTSLNPRMLIKDIIGEPLKVQGLAKGEELRRRVVDMLYKIGLTEKHMYRYPHELSGGQRQRVAIARALITEPEFVVLDEPTSAVDVSVRAQLLKLFKDFQSKLGLTYLFISHDLSVVEALSDRVAVMYLGKVVELAQTYELFKNPMHPYTKALFSAIPIPDPTVKRERIILKGEVPSPVNPPSGCRFHPRCPHAKEICKEKEPHLLEVRPGHFVACHLYGG